MAAAPSLLRVPRLVWRTAMGRFALICVCLLLLCALFAPWLAPHDPFAIKAALRLKGPSMEYWLGNDQLGRDVLSRLIYGSRIAMTVAFFGAGCALAIGTFLGLIAGYGPRQLDTLLMLLCDSVMSIPMILFALAAVTVMGSSVATIIVIVMTFMAPGYFRVVRSQTRVLRQREYVVAARAMGASPFSVVIHHLLPNMTGTLLVLVAMDIPAVIAIESGLSFLGQGVQAPDASWGTVLNDGYSWIRQAPHIVVAAGAPIILATLSFTFLGEALRDALDPRTARPARKE
ncbi:peptide ABC transporter permease [Erwinia sp. OLTSP20]|nr:peptide ABC transporter permease [Erwinia sp. OAMSP11]PIJ71098.1 peptide ABC transporter permease [Erwinia sp. OLSSP12]PIJ79375.1 peptide ABC transporter permease [Erwinia sp. OLCASP19]PIJ80913.1 peptide ABC transporter permease [Erwinia sp. OLMTSP26]PIJ83716.1 peptide ABC transporter permease [Erwinia sp. OLMDSP33]PIJ89510.1 peptide ABC transporter permease [Erwinia sp. OLFS4]PIJ90961.1 peptide ABC transporter permease [Erwinia sp. OLTSP20]